MGHKFAYRKFQNNNAQNTNKIIVVFWKSATVQVPVSDI